MNQTNVTNILRKEIFVEEIFADFGPIWEIKFHEIWFFFSSGKRGLKWARYKGKNGWEGQNLIREIKFRQNFFP